MIERDMECCDYPPRVAADVDVTEQRDGDRMVFVAGATSVGRYVLLRPPAHHVLHLIDGSRTLADISAQLRQRHRMNLPIATLGGFLARLDEAGLLAGSRVDRRQHVLQGVELYPRVALFNPDPLFARLARPLRWIWTKEFFVVTVLLMLATCGAALAQASAVFAYGDSIVREHPLAVIAAALLVGMAHEFAHGLTCKAFGGRSTEVGVLMMFYCVPALYCNVSGIHLIRERARRLWVIAAGLYVQLLAATVALIAWFALVPHTIPADLAFIVFCGAMVDAALNGNPLVKLDGYYFLSQWLRMPNLMDRSRSVWRTIWRRVMFGDAGPRHAQFSRRELAILIVFGLLAFSFNVVIRCLIVVWAGDALMDALGLVGLLPAAALAVVYSRRILIPIGSTLVAAITRTAQFFRSPTMSIGNPVVITSTSIPRWQRLVPTAALLVLAGGLCLPWQASVGNYGTLVPLPELERIVRAPERAALIDLRVRPGDEVAGNDVLARMRSLDVDEQLADAQAEMDRADGEYRRLLGELSVREESVRHADAYLRQRQEDLDDIASEQRQIEERRRRESDNTTRAALALASRVERGVPPAAVAYPPAIAILQSDVDLGQAQVTEAGRRLDRARRLAVGGVIAKSELDAAEARAATLAIGLAGARARLESALIEHRRRQKRTETEVQLAKTEVESERLHARGIGDQLRAVRALLRTLDARQELLQRKHAQFEVTAQQAGTVFGEELTRAAGRYFDKGEEICRIADTRQLLVRIVVPERELDDVRVGQPVRIKARALPDRIFRGAVSRIAGESERRENGEIGYRVELTVDNAEHLLRPGMTTFGRIEFGRRMIAGILLHKARQILRPELWML